MANQTPENTVFAGISPSRLISDLLCLAEWFATWPSDFGHSVEAIREHDKLFKDVAFQYFYEIHVKPNKYMWTRLSWDDKVILALLEVEYLSTMLD